MEDTIFPGPPCINKAEEKNNSKSHQQHFRRRRKLKGKHIFKIIRHISVWESTKNGPEPALQFIPHSISKLMREHACCNKEKAWMPPFYQDNDPQKSNKGTDGQTVKEDPAVSYAWQKDMPKWFIDDVREETAYGTIDNGPAVLCKIQKKNSKRNPN
ncbi:hypothetical protein L0665_07030 [Methanogenium marinum]|uniref:Uncharacterized protein n=1 Tax=Methanogenium marinum TaxID=348610 RepID=A0A9Q4KU72_9EURY|nr:hypothetical protein [Methanogenium marinum]MDE4908363.1 hypothetical protein [Methanogenium marinum]